MKVSNLGKRMMIVISIIVLICLLGSVIYYRSMGFIPFTLGAILGSASSIAKIFLLERTVDRALTMNEKDAKNYVSLHHMLRLLFTGIVLVLGATVSAISLWGVAVGVLSFQIALYTTKFTSIN